jgi:hypothetical protein
MAPPKKQSEPDPMLAVWFAVGLLFALFVGTGAGILGWVSGQGEAAAVLTGGATFGATVTLAVLVISLLRQRR